MGKNDKQTIELRITGPMPSCCKCGWPLPKLVKATAIADEITVTITCGKCDERFSLTTRPGDTSAAEAIARKVATEANAARYGWCECEEPTRLRPESTMCSTCDKAIPVKS